MKLIFFFILFTAGLLIADPAQSLVRVNTTIQTYNASQPWEKTPPRQRRGLGCLLGNQQVLITADMAADAIYLELESSDGNHTVPARVLAIDHEANLALLEPEKAGSFLEKLEAAEVSEPIALGDKLDIYQVETNGMALSTPGEIRSMELISTFSSGSYFLSYLAKASMQSASSSFTLPAFHEGKLVGILTSYDAKDQICEILSVDIIQAFLDDQGTSPYEGFPSLGLAFTTTEDSHFRTWLGLADDQGGLYLSRILPTGTADEAGLKKGDVLLAINGQEIDRRGYFQHPKYGALYWTHLVRGSMPVGSEVTLTCLRDGKVSDFKGVLKRPTDPLVPQDLHDQAPPFLIKGGLIFQELSQDLLQAYGKDWDSKAPLAFLDVLNNPAEYEEGRRRVVILTGVIPTAATIGYERLGGQIVESVNGEKIAGLPELAAALKKSPSDGLHRIDIDEVPYTIFLDEKISTQVDQQFLQRGLPILERLYEIPTSNEKPVNVKTAEKIAAAEAEEIKKEAPIEEAPPKTEIETDQAEKVPAQPAPGKMPEPPESEKIPEQPMVE